MKEPKKLSLTFQTTQDVVSPEDLADAIKTIIEKVKEGHGRISSENLKHRESLTEDLQRVVSEIGRTIDTLSGDIDSRMGHMDEATGASIKGLAERLDELCECVDEMEDFDPSELQAAIAALDSRVVKLSNLDGIAVRDMLAGLDRGEKLRVTDLDGFEDALKDIKNSGKEVRLVGGTNGIQLYVDGSKKGNVKYLNLIAGSGISLTYTPSNGRNDITISASGGGGRDPEVPSGTINGTNATFTFTTRPKVIVVDELRTITENAGFTLDGTGLIATLTIPPNSSIVSI